MKLEGTFAVRAGIEKVWETFMDPHGMTPCIPELQRLDIVDPMHHRLAVEVGVSFIKGDFVFDVWIVEAEMPTHAKLKVHGKGQGSAIDAEGTFELVETGDGTEMRWQADTHVVGKVANVGSRLLQSTMAKRVQEFFDCGRARLEGG
ncbi:MAG: CoxG family protein [Thermoplasmata archaeon]